MWSGPVIDRYRRSAERGGRARLIAMLRDGVPPQRREEKYLPCAYFCTNRLQRRTVVL